VKIGKNNHEATVKSRDRI